MTESSKLEERLGEVNIDEEDKDDKEEDEESSVHQKEKRPLSYQHQSDLDGRGTREQRVKEIRDCLFTKPMSRRDRLKETVYRSVHHGIGSGTEPISGAVSENINKTFVNDFSGRTNADGEHENEITTLCSQQQQQQPQQQQQGRKNKYDGNRNADDDMKRSSSRVDQERNIQYRLTSMRVKKKKTRGKCCCVGGGCKASPIVHSFSSDHHSRLYPDSSSTYCCDGGVFWRFNMSELVANMFDWFYRRSFWLVYLCFFAMMFVWVLLFAIFICWYGDTYPRCIIRGGLQFDPEGNFGFRNFYDAYALSWHTFSTVGYGVIFPRTQSHTSHCHGLQTMMSFEAFVGILYASFCGAILYGKVSRFLGRAPVTFSCPIVIRYGDGLLSTHTPKRKEEEDITSHSDDTSHFSQNNQGQQKNPCPVLEFRIINNLHSVPRGELINASLRCIASVEVRRVCPPDLKSIHPSRRAKKKKNISKVPFLKPLITAATASAPSTKSSKENNTEELPSSELVIVPAFTTGDGELTVSTTSINNSKASKSSRVIDEDPSDLVPPRLLSKMDIGEEIRPSFNRIWVARHVLDDTSPLLTPKVRQKVKRNGGYWPEELNNHTSIREFLHFSKIIVSLSATSSINAAPVYAQYIYEFFDVHIGYEFVDVLFRKRDGSLCVNRDLISDISEQNGGGAEPFPRTDHNIQRHQVSTSRVDHHF